MRAWRTHPVRWALSTGASSAVGVGVGVLLGAYVTAVSGSGTPGAASLDVGDIVVLPLLSAAVAFVAVAAVSFVIAKSRRPGHMDRGDGNP